MNVSACAASGAQAIPAATAAIMKACFIGEYMLFIDIIYELLI